MYIHEWFHYRILAVCRDKKCTHKTTFGIIIPGCRVQLYAYTQMAVL